ncbi:MAG: citramalate synthase, partial [Methanomassiliicoccales archaeon]
MAPERAIIYDTTLRDGAQAEGVSFSTEDKLDILRRLDSFGVDFVEGGWPGSNPKDQEFFDRAMEEELECSELVAFGSTRRANTSPEEDGNLRALLDAGTEWVALVGKSWDLQVTSALRTDLEENLRMVEDSVRYLRENGRRVIFDAEHFYDGYGENRDYTMRVLRSAREAGAELAVLCDTNGGSLPGRIGEITRRVSKGIDLPLGIHAHNDGEMAVANSLTAVEAGAVMVQGTVNGIG